MFYNGTRSLLMFYNGTRSLLMFYNGTRSLLMFYNGTRSLLMFYNGTRSLLMFYNGTRSLLMFYNGTRSLLILRSNYQLKNTSRFKKRIWFPQRCIHISGFHSITSVSLDKLYQGSRNFSEQKLRFPRHKMKFTIN